MRRLLFNFISKIMKHIEKFWDKGNFDNKY